MGLNIRQLHPLFAAEVTGVDVGRPLDAATVDAPTETIDRYAVLVLPEQQLDDERQMAFARNFGELELPRSGRADVARRLRPEMADISNLDAEGDAALADCITTLKKRGTTVLIVSHRPTTIGIVDKILVLKDGVVEMFGPRVEVMGRLTRAAPIHAVQVTAS